MGVAAVSDSARPGYPAASPHSPQEPNTRCHYTEDTPRPGHALSAPPLGREGEGEREKQKRVRVAVEAD